MVKVRVVENETDAPPFCQLQKSGEDVRFAQIAGQHIQAQRKRVDVGAVIRIGALIDGTGNVQPPKLVEWGVNTRGRGKFCVLRVLLGILECPLVRYVETLIP